MTDEAATPRASGTVAESSLAHPEGLRILRQLVDELNREVGTITGYEVRNDRESGKRTYTFVCRPNGRRA